METLAGRYYRVGLRLSGAEHVGPAWLAAAVTGTYPGADLSEVESYDGECATTIVRWRTGSGAIDAGDILSASAQGIELPGAAPTAEVDSVEQLELYAHPADVASSAVESLPAEYNVALKLTAAAALLTAVVYLTNRIRDKEER